MRLIPAIDLKESRCVRLLQGDFEQTTAYSAQPQALLARYSALGADWLHVVDLDGARGAHPGNEDIILGLAADGRIKLQVGGGLRNTAAVVKMLDAGVARAVIGSAALMQVAQVHAWLAQFEAQRLTLAFDVRVDDAGVPCVATHGWQRQSDCSLWSALDAYRDSPLEHVLCTDVARDGALRGPNLALYAQAVSRYPQFQWQASGGIRSAADLRALADTGVSAAISGKALLEDLISPEELRPYLPNA